MRYFFYVLLGAFISLQATQISEQELFLQANELYRGAYYADASEKYEALAHKGYAVWFNLGNCAYHLQEYAAAYAYWLRAEREAPIKVLQALEHNFVRLKQVAGIEAQQSRLQRLVKKISPFGVQLCWIISWCLVWYMASTARWRMRRLILLLVGALTIICGILTVASYYIWKQQYGVTRHETTLYAGPDERYHKVGTIDNISAVLVQGRRDVWCKVRYKDLVGWMPEHDLIMV